MPHVTLLRTGADVDVVERLRADLVLREWAITVDTFSIRASRLPVETIIVAYVPANALDETIAFDCLHQLAVEGRQIVLLDPREGGELPAWIFELGLYSHILSSGLTYDRMFEDVYRALLGPFPPWLDLRIRPSQLVRPTGVSWWNEDIYVADERFEHVVRIGPSDSGVVLPGLFEPHHVHLDRRTLLVANKSSKQV